MAMTMSTDTAGGFAVPQQWIRKPVPLPRPR